MGMPRIGGEALKIAREVVPGLPEEVEPSKPQKTRKTVEARVDKVNETLRCKPMRRKGRG